MRVTIDIPDRHHRQLKIRATQEGRTMRSLILEAMEEVLGESRRKPMGRRIKSPVIPSKNPGALHIDNKKIDDLI